MSLIDTSIRSDIDLSIEVGMFFFLLRTKSSKREKKSFSCHISTWNVFKKFEFPNSNLFFEKKNFIKKLKRKKLF